MLQQTKRGVTRTGAPDTYLARGFRTLELLATGDMTAAQVAAELGVSRSTALRLLMALRETSYVTRREDTKQFGLVAHRFYELATRRPDHADWHEAITLALSGVRDTCGEATMLAVPANGAMVYLEFFPSVEAIAVREQLGTVRPMHSSAIGKAYLSSLSDPELEAELAALSFQGGTDSAPQGPIELQSAVVKVRQLGYALDIDETVDGVSCVAVPVVARGSVVGAAGISGPTSRLSVERLQSLSELLGKAIGPVTPVSQINGRGRT